MVESSDSINTPESRLQQALKDISDFLDLPNEHALRTPEELQTLPERQLLDYLPVDFLPDVTYDLETEAPNAVQPTATERATRATEVIFALRDALSDPMGKLSMTYRLNRDFEELWQEKLKGQ